MDLLVDGGGKAWWAGRRMRCAIGGAGVINIGRKREGDGATPAGYWPMREVLFRADRLGEIVTPLPCRNLSPEDGWCDDPDDPAYNRLVRLPHPTHCEPLWRTDRIYDLIIPLGYNDDPVVRGRGSAIFLHVAQPDFSPTAGCIALARDDLLAVLRETAPGSAVRVLPARSRASGGSAGGRNRRFDAIGNAITAALLGGADAYLARRTIFLGAALLTIPTLVALGHIRGAEIDYGRTRNATDSRQPRNVQRISQLSVSDSESDKLRYALARRRSMI